MSFVAFPGADQVTGNRKYSRSHGFKSPGHHPLLILHSVEGGGVVGRNYIEGHKYPPHIWVDLIGRKIYQTVSMASPASALESGDGFETNGRGLTFQWELFLISDPKKSSSKRYVGNVTDDDLEWLASLIVLQDDIARSLDPHGRGIIPASTSMIRELGNRDSGYGEGSPHRMQTGQEWYDFTSGIATHADVPDNSHYDLAGEFPMRRLVDMAIALRSGTPIIKRPRPIMSKGDYGDHVKGWQQLLNFVFHAKIDADRDYGNITTQATVDAQRVVPGADVTGSVTADFLEQVKDLARRIKAKEITAPVGKEPLPVKTSPVKTPPKPQPTQPPPLAPQPGPDTKAVKAQLGVAATAIDVARSLL